MTKIQIFKGKVIDGKKLGRKIGFPTANIELSKGEKIKFGSWVIKITIKGEVFFGVANIGNRPTVDSKSKNVLLEANIFDFDSDIYGEIVEVELLTFLRSEKQFESIDQLQRAINNDVERARQLILNFK